MLPQSISQIARKNVSAAIHIQSRGILFRDVILRLRAIAAKTGPTITAAIFTCKLGNANKRSRQTPLIHSAWAKTALSR